jgi:hypothetical protein
VSDYAVILKKSNSVQLHILISSGNTYIPWIDHDFKPSYAKTGLNIEHGLSAVSPGHLDFVVNGKEQSLSLVTNGITLVELENITKIYYWADGKLKVMNVRS